VRLPLFLGEASEKLLSGCVILTVRSSPMTPNQAVYLIKSHPARVLDVRVVDLACAALIREPPLCQTGQLRDLGQ
jgi:hypothetical protein